MYLNPRRHGFEFQGGFRENRSFLQAGTFSVQYNNYKHSEINSFTGEINTAFKNKTFSFQGVFDQKSRQDSPAGSDSGDSIGTFRLRVKRLWRRQPNRMRSQFSRLENLGFRARLVPVWWTLGEQSLHSRGNAARGVLPEQQLYRILWCDRFSRPHLDGGAFVANYSHSYRAPSLEELYNNGPHPGNLAFEIGDPNLKREVGNGLDFGLRHTSKRLRFEANGFYYHIQDFVFLAPTGAIDDDLSKRNTSGHYPLCWY